jgi:hypothetical protein
MINKKLGFYRVDNIDFDSKIQACIYAVKNSKNISWHFNQEQFKNYAWNIEPSKTLDELYNQRSRQLRETYDYIIVSYSGGADSHNLLMSFIRQGLHVDEIIVNTTEEATKNHTVYNILNKSSENCSAEHYFQTIPRLKEIQNLSPKTKITILDMSDYLLNSWLKNNDADASWVMDRTEGLNPLNVTRFNYLHFFDIRKQFDKNKKIGIILGVEKPRTFIYKDGNFYIKFIDRSANIIPISNHIKNYSNSTVEYFYWSPEGLDIICKQAHVIKKWLEFNPQNIKLWYYKNINFETYRLIHERILRSLLYTTWDNEWYQVDKATKDWYSEFDSWFINGYRNTKQYYIWQEGIEYVIKNANQFVKFTNGKPDGLKIFAFNCLVGRMNPELKELNLLIDN